MVKRLVTAIAGLGRMGKRHALNYLTRTPRCDLVAAFSPDPAEHEWAKEHLIPFGITLYNDYNEMLDHPGLEAVIISTVTSVHADEAIQALEKGLHCLCEKPLSLNTELARNVVNVAKKHPKQKFMCGFSRRFDQSYRDAYQKMVHGSIGEPVVIRSQTCDKADHSDFFVEYAQHSGGLFVDMSIHDIDLTLWFLGENVVPKSISAYGIRAVHKDMEKFKDFDNAVGIVEFWGGKLAYYFGSRIMAHGQEDTTEIIGTKGKLSVNLNPQSNLVQHYHASGISKDCPPDYYGRFEHAFVTEANEFVAACLDDLPPPLGVDGAIKALEIGQALQLALVTGKPLYFDEQGRRIEVAH